MALQLARPPRDDEELWWVIKALFGVALPRVSVCENHVSPFEAVAHAYFSREPNFAVWYASRGSGKSLALAVLGLTKAFVRDIDVTILGGSMTQSLNVREHMRKLMASPNAPTYAMDKDQATLIQMSTGKAIKPLPASQTTVRGPHPPLQLLDEVDEMEKTIYDASLGQAMEQLNAHGEVVEEYIVASSTWQNPEGTFTQVMEEARERGLPIFSWCWRELLQPHGWMSQRFIDNKRQAVSAQMWHCLPTGELVDTRRGPVPVQQIVAGDEVWTRQGWRPVAALVRQPKAPVYEVRTDDGRSYRATGNHPVATPSGWVLTQQLVVGQTLITADPPHVLPLAGQTDAMPLGIDPPLGRPGMPVGAEVGVGAVSSPVADVRAEGEQGQVARVDAPGAMTVVLDGQSGWYFAEPSGVGQSVGVMDAGHLADAIPVLGGWAGPHPALPVRDGAFFDVGLQVSDAPTSTCRVDSVRLLPAETVWDLSVAQTHEFTVNGIVTHNTEYDLNEPAAGGRAIDLDKVEKYFVSYPTPLTERHDGNGDHDEWTWEEPQVGAAYAVGTDWAKEQDKTVIGVIRYDVTPRRMVKLIRINRRPWDYIIGRFNAVVRDYHAVAEHDRTGLGNVVGDYLDYSDVVAGFTMIGRPRTQMLLDFITSFEHGDYQLPLIPKPLGYPGVGENPLKRALRAVTVADVYAPSKWNSHLPDDMAMMALAHRAIEKLPQPIRVPVTVPKDGSPRKADAPFHRAPEAPSYSEGGVTVVDERYTPASSFLVGPESGRDPWEAMNV